MKSTDVIISGGGVPGLTLGILLAKAGLQVTVCDPSPVADPEKIAPSGRTIALMEGSLDVLKRAGIHQKIETVSQDLKTLSVVPDENFRADFHAFEIGRSRFGQNVQNPLLQAYAAKIFKALPGAVFIQDKILSFADEKSHIAVEFSNGDILTGKLLVGADGRASIVREKSGIGVWSHDYKQTAITGIVRHELSHRDASTEFHYPGGPFTLVPMQDSMSSFVWMEKTSDAQSLLKKSPREIETIMEEKSRFNVGKISLVTGLSSHPVKIQKAKKIIGNRVALIAEAAHVLSPIGAQGLNLSLRDVAALYESILASARLGLDIGSSSTLRAYEVSRLADIALRVAGTDALNRTVATKNSFLNNLRRLGFQAATAVAPLRAVLMREALAPGHSLLQEIVSGLDTRATVNMSTRDAPAS